MSENIVTGGNETHDEPLPLIATTVPAIGGRAHPSGPVLVPHYDRSALRPSIVHIGVGGFHRAHLAMYIDALCAGGETAWAIVGAGIMPGDAAMAEALAAQDHLYTLVVRGGDGISVSIIGSMVDYILAHPDPTGLIERIAHPKTQIVSMTITESGYPVDDSSGNYDPDSPVAGADSAFGVLARGLDLRRQRGADPLTVMSCDNILANGTVSRAATLGEAALISDDLAAWIAEHIAFPNSMVDRITPATTDADRTWLTDEVGIVDRWPVFTEPFTLWVLEDRFAGDRPPFEALDVVLTDNVKPFEMMKLRLLNAAHSVMTYLAALAGHNYVHAAMADRALMRYVQAFLDREARPVLPPVPDYDVDLFQGGLIDRFANPAIRDQISRLCLDGSAKFPKFLLPTVRAQLEAGGPIELSALALAGWCLYLRGVDDENGTPIEVAPDVFREAAMAAARTSIDDPPSFLSFENVFGQDLPQNERFVDAFVRSLRRLENDGVAAAISATLAVSGP